MEESKKMDCKIVNCIITILERIENSKLSNDALEEIKEPLSVLADYLGTTVEQALIFAVIFALQTKLTSIELRDIVSFLEISVVESINLNLKLNIDQLYKKQLIEFCEDCGKVRKIKTGSTNFRIPESISELIYNNKPIEIKKTEPVDIYFFIKTASEFVHYRKFDSIDTEQLIKLIADLEEENRHLTQIFNIRNRLAIEDRIILYEMLNDKVNLGSPVSALELTISDIFENPRQQRLKIREIVDKTNMMCKQGLIELSNAQMAVDLCLMLTDKAIEFFLQGDASLFIKVQKAKNLVSHKNIVQKELFYNEDLSKEVSFLTESLMNENFTSVQNRLKTMGLAKGVACLFYGCPGTGKTETCYQIAKLTGRDIMRVDISQQKSKWFGDSEKKIKEIFDNYRNACRGSNNVPILLFNEADALLGRRQKNGFSNVAQTENAIQNILLEELENFEGIAFFTTNLQGNLDSAYERRFLFKVKFNSPSIEVKAKIWMNNLPWIDPNIVTKLASDFEFSGGEIVNIVRKVAMQEVITGLRPEYSEIEEFCQQEKLLNRKKDAVKIGFS